MNLGGWKLKRLASKRTLLLCATLFYFLLLAFYLVYAIY